MPINVIGALLLRLVLFVLGLSLIPATAYIVFFGGGFGYTNLTNALYYGAQTITTTGYGDWAPENLPGTDARVVLMKGLSVLFMVVGATLFGVAVSYFVVILNDLIPR